MLNQLNNKVMIRGILIDTENRTIKEVNVTSDNGGSQLPSIYGHVKCLIVETILYDEKNDIYVDEEGLLTVNENSTFFKLKNFPQPIVGNGLIMGFDIETGENVSTNLDVEEVEKNITFLTSREVLMNVH